MITKQTLDLFISLLRGVQLSPLAEDFEQVATDIVRARKEIQDAMAAFGEEAKTG